MLYEVITLQQRLAVGGEAQASAVVAVVERLDAQAVAGQEQALVAHVPDAEGEHAVQVLRRPLAPGVERLENHLRVAAGEEAVTEGGQLLAQLRMVVDGARITSYNVCYTKLLRSPPRRGRRGRDPRGPAGSPS